MFLAGNQLGKTLAGGGEMAMHLTGIYPDWWNGRRWDRPIVAWAAGVTGESTRDNPQRVLMGRPGNHGTGTIPLANIVTTTRAMGVTDLLDTVRVSHASGGESVLSFKFYEKGREKWQGETLDLVWFDEEPPKDIYSEGLTRTNATGGITFVTATPLLGMTEVVGHFYPRPDTDDRHLTQMTIEDVGHYTPAERKKIIDAYPAHEREARAKGVPMLGSGRVFPVAEEMIACDPFAIPQHWVHIGGIDFGWDHPFAGVHLAWDRDADVIYVVDNYRVKEQPIAVHVGAVKSWKLLWAWPHDGLQHDPSGGKQLQQLYREAGLDMCMEHAQFEGERGMSVEAGVAEMLNRMLTGKFKVFRHLHEWFSEFRTYHRDEGKIVKLNDDLLSATRYGLMMRRFARPNKDPWGGPMNFNDKWVV